jgi:putative hydrolase of the HAD superfamily
VICTAARAAPKTGQDGTVISVVLFDLDDTIFAHRLAVNAGARSVLRGLDEPPPADLEDDEVARWTALEELHYTRYLTGDLDYLGQRRARARDFLLPYDIALDTDTEAEAWFDYYLSKYRSAWDVYPDTMPVLDALADRRLGVITNGELGFQLAKMDATDLTARFEHIVASGELGVTKPDPRIFHAACELFAVAPADAVYVGDRLHTDALGAVGAGLRGIWIDRLGATTAQREEASAAGVSIIRNLAELPALLA